MYRLTNTNAIIRLADGAFIPDDPANIDRRAYEAWLEEGNTPEPVTVGTPEQVFLRLQAVVQKRLDEWARERGYESILSLCTYATSTVPKFQAEGQRGVEVRDSFWQFGYELLAQIEAGEAPIPTEEGLLAMMPPLTWTDVY